jgi:hypothetical protein
MLSVTDAGRYYAGEQSPRKNAELDPEEHTRLNQEIEKINDFGDFSKPNLAF